jgi:hypothetical protein
MHFGKALWQVIRCLKSENPHLGPVYLSKINISDGFYRIWVRASDVPKLGVLFPSADGEEYLVGPPLALSMGCTESPKIFTAATETVSKLTNDQLAACDTFTPTIWRSNPKPPPPAIAATSAVNDPAATETDIFRPEPLPHGDHPKGATHYYTPLALWDVYVDDFFGMVQGGPRVRRHAKCTLLHTLDTMLRPLDRFDSVHGQDPASIKKMAKCESSWATIKVITGWIINKMDGIVSFSAHRLSHICEILASISATHRRASLKKWQQVLGELRSMALAIPTAIGLFYILTKSHPPRGAAILGRKVWVVCTLCLFPMSSSPLLWRSAWPQSITSKLVSTNNPCGTVTITNIDLELYVTIAQSEVLVEGKALPSKPRTSPNIFAWPHLQRHTKWASITRTCTIPCI